MRFLLVASAEIRRFELCGALPAFNHGPVTLRVYAGALTLSSACEARLAFVAFGSGEGKAYSTSDGPAHHQVPYIYGGVRSHQPAFRCPSLYVPDIDLSFTLSTADRTFECQALTETTPIDRDNPKAMLQNKSVLIMHKSVFEYFELFSRI